MKRKSKKLLSASLYGMDGRTHKTMLMFLQGPCGGVAQVVHETEAEIDIIDADAINAKDSLDLCLAREPLRPIIILSLEMVNIENTIYVKKPVKTETMLAAFKEAGDILEGKKKKSTRIKKTAEVAPIEKKTEQPAPAPKAKKQKVEELSSEKKVYVNALEQKKTQKHKAAMMINEQNFSSFIGIVSGIDFNAPDQWSNASYDPKQYYQGYVQSAVKVAFSKGQILKLNSGWKPLIVLPHSHEAWLDADDKQLRAFASVAVRRGDDASSMTLSAVNPKEEVFSSELDKFHEINAFLWKLACWTSKGRYPVGFDLAMPVYLKQWPNFTRLVITPHAMRISALLTSSPRSIKDVIQILKIQPQYVFIFISATYATGLLGQAKRQADKIVEAEVPAVKSVKKKGLLSRILKKLQG
ncbi:MAG: hypothetical protein GQ583_07475 [Methyloprofundus sp.]|nr:hypothetical protein [Methyloprofundus sp.]